MKTGKEKASAATPQNFKAKVNLFLVLNGRAYNKQLQIHYNHDCCRDQTKTFV